MTQYVCFSTCLNIVFRHIPVWILITLGDYRPIQVAICRVFDGESTSEVKKYEILQRTLTFSKNRPPVGWGGLRGATPLSRVPIQPRAMLKLWTLLNRVPLRPRDLGIRPLASFFVENPILRSKMINSFEKLRFFKKNRPSGGGGGGASPAGSLLSPVGAE